MSLIDIAKSYIHAVQTGDQAALAGLIAPDVVWHQPGQNRFSGTHRGLPAVVNLIGSMMEASGGTFAITRAVRFMVNGDWVAIELEFAGQRDGIKLAQPGIDLLRIEGGRIVEVRLFSSDQDAEDAFWGQ
jgi:ketosteroid isomerase-like protein